MICDSQRGRCDVRPWRPNATNHLNSSANWLGDSYAWLTTFLVKKSNQKQHWLQLTKFLLTANHYMSCEIEDTYRYFYRDEKITRWDLQPRCSGGWTTAWRHPTGCLFSSAFTTIILQVWRIATSLTCWTTISSGFHRYRYTPLGGKNVPNCPVGRNFCLTQEETPRTKTNADAVKKMPNIIWSPTHVVFGRPAW